MPVIDVYPLETTKTTRRGGIIDIVPEEKVVQKKKAKKRLQKQKMPKTKPPPLIPIIVTAITGMLLGHILTKRNREIRVVPPPGQPTKPVID